MFFYISFLRPPPLQVAPSGPVLITPQISNDLRTEPYAGSQDLYYSWAPYPQPPTSTSSSSPSSAQLTLKPTKPIKLTTYRNASAFKEIPVPVPPGVLEGQQWKLILSSSAQTTSLAPNYGIDTYQCTVGENAPFPVTSMPIMFSTKGLKGNVKKHERIERIYRLSTGEGSTPAQRPPELRITEQISFDLDKKIWDSGIGLSSWLIGFQASEPNTLDEPLRALWGRLFSSEPRHIVELGAGTGIVSLTVAALRSQITAFLDSSQEDKILATDLGTAINLLNLNIISNLPSYPLKPPEAGVLDWDDEELPDSVKSLKSIDVILMSDVTYNTDSFSALLSTISKLLQRGDGPPVILLGYKERDEAERSLWSMMEKIGIRLDKIGQRKGFMDPPVEIWFGRHTRR